MEMEAISGPLKIYFLPFMAQGHLIPLVHVARLFAARGEHVTIITTPHNAKLFAKSIEHDDGFKLRLCRHIHVHTIAFPSKEVGLPEGLENMFFAADNDTAAKICTAGHLIQPQVEAFVEANPPHVMVTDLMYTWTAQLTTRLGIPRLAFNAMSIFASCMIEALKRHPEALSSDHSEPSFVVPGLPHPITLTVRPSAGFLRLTQGLIEAEHNTLGVIIDSFPEIEPEYSEHYEKLTGRKVWHVGPALLMLENQLESTSTDMLGGDHHHRHECLKWLGTQEHGSVVYISFGSLRRFPDDQLLEIACGLEASGHKFLWVVHRKHDDDDDDEKEDDRDKWLTQRFEERMREENRGMIVRGWAPQVLILNHPAVGGFLSHCGWNAMAEAIAGGVPMVTMPGFGDQYYNEKLITQVRGFGVEVGAQEWSLSPYDAKKLVGRERIEEGVRRLMDGGDEATQVRRRAKELQEKAWKAIEQDGSSNRNLTALIQQMKKQLCAIQR